ncbi:hypothetical protein G7Y41_08715 [Schaalia sp. ZJ405]|uniref:hypothetical protein n=1 Tax=Schaalia sp. ZJ405 TaxID=2709403 RepID=UPI0013EBEB6D|nr:hypothetical protein [Schaalia sp. ZJ405]QPK81106.1 hypothetical protein G7Y41_08715 [Schaalia sp. ZJ405]
MIPQIDTPIVVALVTAIATISVAVIGGIGAIIGHWFTGVSKKEDAAISVMKATMKELREEVNRLTKKVDSLELRLEDKDSRYRAAIEYCRELVRLIERLLSLVPGEFAQPLPEPPEKIRDDI